MTTGEKIRYFRTSHELTQEQLASQSGLSISALQKYESDERKPKPEQLLKISDALGISINIFMDFDIRTVSDLFSLLFRMEEQANLRFYKDTTTDTVGIYFENEYITEKISSYAEMLREIDSMKGRKIDIAFVPLDPRQEEAYYMGMDYFIKNVGANEIYPMHFWGEPRIIDRYKSEYGGENIVSKAFFCK